MTAPRWILARAGALGGGSRYMPEVKKGPKPSFDLTRRKAIEPSEDETRDNPRARSARLRFVVRTDAPAWTAPVETGKSLPPLKALEAVL